MIETKHRVTIVSADEDRLTLEIDGEVVSAGWGELSVRLAEAPAVARQSIVISPAGYGLHWPLVDEDLSIDGILRDFGP
ncbi:MAG: DUF2442 domain-containing protein [Spirochaeta sp.]|jgi:hypothetical protein|nr:DUF2442 domain-containing protein [Spirochaeta sp.]